MSDFIKTLIDHLLKNEDVTTNLMEEVVLSDNQILFNQGDRGDAFYLVKEGKLKIFILDSQHKSMVLNILSSGDTLGELALLDTQPRSAGAIAVGDCVLFRLDREKFLDQLEKSPDLMREMITLLISRIRYNTRYIMDLGQWARLIINGEYKEVLNKIEEVNIEEDQAIASVAESLKEMVQVIFEREEFLKQEVNRLKVQISIDQKQKEKDIKEITNSESFDNIIKTAERIRSSRKK
jgi:CRP-like cAMP-binding protein